MMKVMSIRAGGAIVLVALAGAAAPASAQLCPPHPIAGGQISVSLDIIADTRHGDPVNNALALVESGDGRQFLVNRLGTIHVIENGVIDPVPTLDITAEILSINNRGITGFVAHKDFADPSSPGFHKVYVYFTQPVGTAPATWPINASLSHQNVLTEWTMDALDPNRVQPGSKREIFRADHRSVVHMGGDLKWGPDGYLYVAIGGPINRHISSQENDHPDGTIMRIDPLEPALTPLSPNPASANGRYRVPIDNPFVGVPNVTPEVWAYGFRHQWRMSFDAVTGELFTGDVGHASYEEINHVVRGGNYGWPFREGPCDGTQPMPNPPPTLIDPLIAYSHDDGLAVIGGYVYRGSAMPALRGKYIFADLSRTGHPDPGRLLIAEVYDEFGSVLPPSNSGIAEVRTGNATPMLNFTVHSLAEDAEGELYLLGVGRIGSVNFSTVQKIVPRCWADCDQTTGPGTLDIFDFLCFGLLFAANDPYACNCDTTTGVGVCDIFDFLCFGSAFGMGCP